MKFNEGIALTVFVAGGFVVLTALDGFVLSSMWGWFIAEPFGAPAIEIAHAIGLIVLIRFVTHKGDSDCDSKPNPDPANKLIGVVAVPVFAYVLGYVMHLWMKS